MKAIIGIAGTKGSGKDTVASMINYITTVGVNKADYRDYIMNNLSIKERYKHRIIHFADSVKKVLSEIYNIDLEYFYDEEYKDNKLYCFNERRFLNERDVTSKYRIIHVDNLLFNSLGEVISKTIPTVKCIIKLRTLMQYFATDICRKYLGDNIWVDSTIIKAKYIVDTDNICIIPDVRFKNEANAINCSSTGVIVRIVRDTVEDDNSKHISEQIDFVTDYYINNNGSKMQLFYKVLNVIQDIIYKQNKLINKL